MTNIEPGDLIESLFKVESKTSINGERVIPFKLNDTQVELEIAAKTKKMNAILKARQLGCSTYIEARFLAKCMTVNSTHAAVVSHEKQATTRLLRRVHFFIDHLSDEVRETVPLEYSNKYELTFPKTNSSFYIGTAGQRAFTRGDMLTDFHGSEVAYWSDPEQLMNGVLGAITSDAEVWLESTGNGMGGYFYDTCMKAMQDLETGKESPFGFLFFPWTNAEEYQKPIVSGFMLTPEEELLIEKYGLSNEQINWMRWKKAQYKSSETFYQEFPLSPEEAFISSGTCYFDKTALRLYQNICKDPMGQGSIEIIKDEARFLRTTTGKVKIWDFPRRGEEYLIVVDCSEGIENDSTDSTHIQCIARSKFAQAASINGKLDPIQAANEAYALGKYYNWPVIAVEDNGPGLGCIFKLKELGYPRIYKQKRYDLESQKELERFGWHTDQRTRPLALSELRQAIRGQIYRIFDKDFIKECTTFCKQKDGTYKANSGCYDDRVMANAIALYLHKMIPLSISDPYESKVEDREVLKHGYKTGY